MAIDHIVPTKKQAEGVKVWPSLGLAAIDSHMGGAWRFWRLAHHYDTQGSGKVAVKEFRNYLKELGVNERTIRRWRNQAIDHKLLWHHKKSDHYILVGLARAGLILGVDKVARPAKVPAVYLVKQGWRSHVWAGRLATIPGLMSRETHYKITNVHPKQQSRYEQKTGVTYRKTYEITRVNHKNAGASKRAYHSGVFVWTGYLPKRKKNKVYKVVAVRKPDYRYSPYYSCVRGRSAKAQRLINHARRMIMQTRSYCSGLACPRLFHETKAQALEAIERVREYIPELIARGVHELFYKRWVGDNTTTWHTLRLSNYADI